MDQLKKKIIFGVFYTGKLVFAFNTTICTETQADFIVRILDLAKDSLEPGHYFAYDYVE